MSNQIRCNKRMPCARDFNGLEPCVSARDWAMKTAIVRCSGMWWLIRTIRLVWRLLKSRCPARIMREDRLRRLGVCTGSTFQVLESSCETRTFHSIRSEAKCRHTASIRRHVYPAAFVLALCIDLLVDMTRTSSTLSFSSTGVYQDSKAQHHQRYPSTCTQYHVDTKQLRRMVSTRSSAQ